MRSCAIVFAALLGGCASESTAPAAALAEQRLASGLVYRVVREGTGTQPAASDVVTVHYRGHFPDGREFDSSYARGKPAQFPLNRVIACWTEALQRMKVGGQAKLTCPPGLAYGDRGAGDVIPPGATLQFDVELLGVERR